MIMPRKLIMPNDEDYRVSWLFSGISVRCDGEFNEPIVVDFPDGTEITLSRDYVLVSLLEKVPYPTVLIRPRGTISLHLNLQHRWKP